MEYPYLLYGQTPVKLRVKPQPKTIYRWEYYQEVIDSSEDWIDGGSTDTSSTRLGDLIQGKVYWFRMVFINKYGESIPYNPINFLVN
jgi:hypothetical protein